MEERRWLVLLCQGCGQSSGHVKQTGRCPHCGQAFSKETVVQKTVDSPDALMIEVALANTPDELRAELGHRIKHQHRTVIARQDVSLSSVWDALREAASSDGVLTLSAVSEVLKRTGHEATAEDVLGQAEVEGLVLRAGQGRWVFLE
jgi:hypothetical protein